MVPTARAGHSSHHDRTASNSAGGGELVRWVGEGLEAALKARGPGVHASTPMVRQLASRVGDQLCVDPETFALLDLSAQVRDIGMLGLPDSVVLATAPLSPTDWALVNAHPVLGAGILERLTPVAAAADPVRSHHERWDGDGYPDGRRGDQIPLISRIIATCDAFVAMASDRPHRRGAGAEAALEQVRHERGAQFDPQVVDALVAVLVGGGASTEPRRSRARPGSSGQAPRAGSRATVTGRRDLTSAIAELDVLSAFAPAYDRVLAATVKPDAPKGEIVAAIESDTGLTVAVLRRAQAVKNRPWLANVTDAVAALTVAEIREAIGPLPRAEFPWGTTPLEALMHGARVHAQAVTRAAVRISREMEQADEVVAAALLHDVGKLVIARADGRYQLTTDLGSVPAEQRVQQERRLYGLDHASLGSLLLQRWGLPKRLASAVSGHHTAEADDEVATYVRLADTVAHHSQGDVVDRSKMLRLANACGLTGPALRDLLFDLPHSGGSDRRRAEPTPLTRRETTVLRLLAQGKLYKVIADELGISTSTIRSHLHKTYTKMAVADRAQAVLKATEMGWI